MLTFLYSDQGTPASLRKMDGFGVHAFKFVNARNEVTYVKFNWRSRQGLKRFTAEEAAADSARNFSGLTEDLYNAIKAEEFPSWELCVQTMKADEFAKLDFDPLDDTKIWPDVPERKVGKMTLNRVPDNYFQTTEQSAFSPGMLVPGIEASEDKMLQGRLFSYADTQRHRIGANYLMLPVNRPYKEIDNNNQDGAMNFGRSRGDVNYEPSRRAGGRADDKGYETTKPDASRVVQRPIAKTQNFKQAGELYRTFTENERANLIKNMSGDLLKVKDEKTRQIAASFFFRADVEYGTRLAKAAKIDLDAVKKLAEMDEAEAYGLKN